MIILYKINVKKFLIAKGAGVVGVSGIKIFKFIIYLFQNTQPTSCKQNTGCSTKLIQFQMAASGVSHSNYIGLPASLSPKGKQKSSRITVTLLQANFQCEIGRGP